MQRPPRQSWHEKAPGANRFNRYDQYNRPSAVGRGVERTRARAHERLQSPPQGLVQRSRYTDVLGWVPLTRSDCPQVGPCYALSTT